MNLPKIQVNPSATLKPLPQVSDLEFGKHFTDHWFHSKYSEGRGWHSATVEKYGLLPLDPAASVLHYGQSLFEGMKAYAQADDSLALFRPEFNWRRLCDGAERLCLAAPPQELFMSGVRELLTVDARWAFPDEGCSLYIRPTLIGAEPFLGVRPAREVLFYVLLSPVSSYYAKKDKPLRIWVEDQDLRAAPGGLGAVKAGGNYAASLRAAQRAKRNGYDQVLWLDVHHQGIEEVGTMNVFWVFENEIVTPALNGSILPGGMRESVVHLLKHSGKNVSERRITIDEVCERHRAGDLLEAFGTGTAVMIAPIGELGYKGEVLSFNGAPGPVSQWLGKTMRDLQTGRIPDPFGWMVSLRDL